MCCKAHECHNVKSPRGVLHSGLYRRIESVYNSWPINTNMPFNSQFPGLWPSYALYMAWLKGGLRSGTWVQGTSMKGAEFPAKFWWANVQSNSDGSPKLIHQNLTGFVLQNNSCPGSSPNPVTFWWAKHDLNCSTTPVKSWWTSWFGRAYS